MLADALNASTLRSFGGRLAEVIDSLTEAERHWVDTHLRPIVTIDAVPTTNQSLSLGQSHFGGDPHVPEDFNWPKSAWGPLRFLAQIALADIRNSAAAAYHDLPADGWLLVFACDEDDVQPGMVDGDEEGSWVEIPGLIYVTYVPSSATLHPVANQWGGFEDMTPEECDEFGLAPPSADEMAHSEDNWVCALRFGESYDVPNIGDVDQPPLSNHEGVYALQSLLRRGWTSKMMGWPCHYRTSNTSPGPDWLDIFTFGSDDGPGWSWCDGQHLDVYVRRDGVANATFTPFYGYAA